jgi:hypothetical protein
MSSSARGGERAGERHIWGRAGRSAACGGGASHRWARTIGCGGCCVKSGLLRLPQRPRGRHLQGTRRGRHVSGGGPQLKGSRWAQIFGRSPSAWRHRAPAASGGPFLRSWGDATERLLAKSRPRRLNSGYSGVKERGARRWRCASPACALARFFLVWWKKWNFAALVRPPSSAAMAPISLHHYLHRSAPFPRADTSPITILSTPSPASPPP